MYLGTESGLSMIWVIVVLEVLLMVDSVALTVLGKRLIVKIVNIVLAIFWLVCVVMNIISYGLL
jgi:hypothetical protein